MKRYALPLFVAIYVALGIGLSIQAPSHTPEFTDGKIQWNPFTEEMTLRVTSRHAIINLDEFDAENTRIVCDHPDSQVIIRVTGGNPTRLMGKVPALPNGVILVNPAGVYVGPESVVNVGALNVLSTLDLIPEETSLDEPFSFLSGDSLEDARKATGDGDKVFLGNFVEPDETTEASSVELKAHGNVYALAVKKNGVVRASGKTNGRVILSAEPEKSED